MFPEGGLNAISRLRDYVQERMTQLSRGDGARAITHIAEGRPYAEIVRLASETDADLIVIGTNVHASLFGGAPVLGSEIERVVQEFPVSGSVRARSEGYHAAASLGDPAGKLRTGVYYKQKSEAEIPSRFFY